VRKVSDNSLFFSNLTGNVLPKTLGGFPHNGTQYKWRVAGYNSLGYGPWTAYRTFTNSP
jgi:hypothetical protein